MQIRFRPGRENPSILIEFLHISRASYKALSELLGGMTVIPPMPVKDVERQVLQHALQQLPSLTALEVSSQKV